jgi:hypothetical protein
MKLSFIYESCAKAVVREQSIFLIWQLPMKEYGSVEMGKSIATESIYSRRKSHGYELSRVSSSLH